MIFKSIALVAVVAIVLFVALMLAANSEED